MNGNGNGNGGIPVVNAPPPPAPAADPRQAAQLDRSDKEAARQEYLSATNAHEKTLENVRRLRQKKEEYNANIRNLTDSMDGESCPEKRKVWQGCIRKQKKIRTNCLKKVKEALKVEERARTAMEDAKDMWLFEKICSG